MKPGTYDQTDPDGEFGIQHMPDSMISLERNWYDFDYDGIQLKVEIVKYLDGTTCCNGVEFLDPVQQIRFLESIDGDQMTFTVDVDEKLQKLFLAAESKYIP